MTDDEMTRLQHRIDDLMTAPLTVVARAIADLERLRSELEAELDAHRGNWPDLVSARRSGDVHRDQSSSDSSTGAPVKHERRHSLVAFGEPIGVNRQSFQG